MAFHLNTLVLIILIQQPEPSGSEAGVSQVKNWVREILLTKHLTHALQGSFTCRKSMIWDQRFYFLPKGSALRIFYHPQKSTILDWAGICNRESRGTLSLRLIYLNT
jgi:hypothetical protein